MTATSINTKIVECHKEKSCGVHREDSTDFSRMIKNKITETATIWETVLYLPAFSAAITLPLRIAMSLDPVTTTSRTKMIKNIHSGTSSICIKIKNAARIR